MKLMQNVLLSFAHFQVQVCDPLPLNCSQTRTYHFHRKQLLDQMHNILKVIQKVLGVIQN